MAKHQTSYRLEDCLSLLEQRDRAILDVTPVKQNIPPELFEELKQLNNHDQMIQTLKDFIGYQDSSKQKSKPIINDVQVIKPDLKQYDSLAINTSKEKAQ